MRPPRAGGRARVAFVQARAVDESLALCDLAGELLARGHRSRLFLDWHEPDLHGAVGAWRPDVIFVQAPMLGEPWSLDVLRRLPPAPTVLVGTGITFDPELLGRAVVAAGRPLVALRGELDDAAPALVERLAAGDGLREAAAVPGGVSWDGRAVCTPLGPPPSLDGRAAPLRALYFDRYPFLGRFPWKRMSSGRGCLHACGYCYAAPLRALHDGARPGVRRKSVDRVVAEALELRSRWPLERVHFADDLFLPSPAWLEEFAERWPTEVGVPFSANSSPETLTERNTGLLARAGCVLVGLGVESGVEALRAGPLGRPTRDRAIVAAVGRLQRAGVQVQTFNMLGFPGEQVADALATVAFNQRLRPDRVRATLAWPMRGSRMHHELVEGGKAPVGLERATKSQMSAVCLQDRDAFEALAALFRLGVKAGVPPRLLGGAARRLPPRLLRPLTLYDGFQELRWSGVGLGAGLAYAARAGRPVHRVTYHVSLP